MCILILGAVGRAAVLVNARRAHYARRFATRQQDAGHLAELHVLGIHNDIHGVLWTSQPVND